LFQIIHAFLYFLNNGYISYSYLAFRKKVLDKLNNVLLKLDDAVGRLERLEEKGVIANDNDDIENDIENELSLNDMEQLTRFEEQLKSATFFTKMVIRHIKFI